MAKLFFSRHNKKKQSRRKQHKRRMTMPRWDTFWKCSGMISNLSSLHFRVFILFAQKSAAYPRSSWRSSWPRKRYAGKSIWAFSLGRRLRRALLARMLRLKAETKEKTMPAVSNSFSFGVIERACACNTYR